jgi:putative tryptophan/tyrosine transport system substrate-binding protein
MKPGIRHQALGTNQRVKLVAFALCAMLFAFGPGAEAQQPTKIPRLGYLSGIDAATHSTRSDAFRQSLRQLGYIERQNIIVEYRYAEGKLDRLPELAAELVRLNVDVILASAPPPTRAAKGATSTIPIVMAFDDDPVGNGFVATLARPGGNITGLSSLAPEISGKQLELLKEIVPKLSRVGVLGTSTVPQYAQVVKEIELAAKAFGVEVQYLDVLNAKGIESAFRAASKEHADAVVVLGSPILNSQRKQIVKLAAKSRLPLTSSRPEYVEDGALMTYGVNINDLFRRAAIYVDKILKGAKPADLPIEQPTKFELIINLKTAKQIGLTIPPKVLARADRVIQ